MHFGCVALLGLILAGGIGLGLYFVPAIIAFSRNHRNRVAILVLDLLLGWTLLGWVGALVWSLTADVDGPIPIR
jgi:Superinfection immunity protein